MKRILTLTVMPLLLAGMLSACGQELSVEQQVIGVIRDMESRIEARERRPFMRHVAAQFTGQNGTMNRDQFNALVLYHLHRDQNLHAQLFPIQVTSSDPGYAEARFRALLTGGAGWLPERGQIYDIVTRWQQRDDEWMLVSAQWKPAVLENALDL